jgi:hypothetical protein
MVVADIVCGVSQPVAAGSATARVEQVKDDDAFKQVGLTVTRPLIDLHAVQYSRGSQIPYCSHTRQYNKCAGALAGTGGLS